MDIAYYKTFILVAKYGSISIASEEVHLTQPAVTKQIRAIESLYNIKLFERGSRLTLTEEGKALLGYANQIVDHFNESFTAVGEIGEQVRGSLRFGSNLTLGIYVLPALIQQFSDIYPQVKVDIFLHNSEHIIRAVKKKELNFGFISTDVDDKDVVRQLFYKDRIVAVAASTLGLRNEPIQWDNLQNLSYITRERGSDIREAVEFWLKKDNITLNPHLVFNNTEAIKECIRSGKCFSFLPHCCVKTWIHLGIFDVLCLPRFHPVQEFYIYHYKGRKFSRPERFFLEFLAKAIAIKARNTSGRGASAAPLAQCFE